MRPLATEAILPLGEERSYFRKVFAWMGVGLAVTGRVAAGVGHSQRALNALLTGSGWIFIGLILIEFALVGGLVGLVQHMDLFEAGATFLGYSALNGVTLSVIFAVFTTKSIFATFFVAAAMFGALALVGYATSIDLTGLGGFLFMALVGQIVGVVVNIFWLNETLYWVTTATGVLDLLGLHRVRRSEAEALRNRWGRGTGREGRHRGRTGALPRLRQPVPLSAADLRAPQVVMRAS